MQVLPKRIKITSQSALIDLLEEAKKTPLILEQNGESYRLTREEKKKPYDAKKVQKVLQETPAILSDKEADKMIADIYRWRKEGSRPENRP